MDSQVKEAETEAKAFDKQYPNVAAKASIKAFAPPKALAQVDLKAQEKAKENELMLAEKQQALED